MPNSQTPLTISQISPRFEELLVAEGTSREAPTLAATWKAFAKFCDASVDCDDERLFFEADLSASQADCFYVHFSRTCYGRQPAGHVWSHELICDFVFPLESSLEEFNVSVEMEEPSDDSDARNNFLAEVRSHTALWSVLSSLEPTETQIYIGES